jgi:TRAP transporter TAXI family solute receptor
MPRWEDTRVSRQTWVWHTARPLAGSVVVWAAGIAGTQACARGAPAEPPPRAAVRIATGSTEGVFHTVGSALASVYNEKLPSLRASTQYSGNSQSSADAIERGEAELAFEGARTTYLAYKKGTSSSPTPHTRLRALAALFPTVVHIIAGRDSGVRSVSDLKGKRVFVGPPDSPPEQASRVVLESHGLSYQDVQAVFERDTPIVDQLRSGGLDAVFLFVPVAHGLAAEVTRSGGARLVPIAENMMAAIRSRSPLLKAATIPATTYHGQTQTVATVGTDVLLVCRDDLQPELAYELTKTLFEAVDRLTQAYRGAAVIDPNRGPAATIPLHPGAARYYRERELFR